MHSDPVDSRHHRRNVIGHEADSQNLDLIATSYQGRHRTRLTNPPFLFAHPSSLQRTIALIDDDVSQTAVCHSYGCKLVKALNAIY